MPDDYKGVFEILREPLGLDPDLVAGLSAAAGMRNVLVHAYLEVDDDQVWNAGAPRRPARVRRRRRAGREGLKDRRGCSRTSPLAAPVGGARHSI